jgi:hypothetical protein
VPILIVVVASLRQKPILALPNRTQRTSGAGHMLRAHSRSYTSNDYTLVRRSRGNLSQPEI